MLDFHIACTPFREGVHLNYYNMVENATLLYEKANGVEGSN